MSGRYFLKNLFALLAITALSASIARADIFTTANIGNDGYILRTDNSGNTTVFSSPASGVPYNLLQGIAFNNFGTLFVANTEDGEGRGGLYTVNGAGTPTLFKTLDILYTQGGIAVDSSNHIYAADYDSGSVTSFIRKYDSVSGTLAASWDTTNEGEAPSSMVYNSFDGNLYVTNFIGNSVGYYDSGGTYHQYVSLDTYQTGYLPEGIASDDIGNIYVSGGQDQDQIVKIDASQNITGYVTSDLSGALGLEWNGTALVIANQACGCGPTNSLELSNGTGGATQISDLGADYYPQFVALSPIPEPSTVLLLGGAMVAVGFFYLRRRKPSTR